MTSTRSKLDEIVEAFSILEDPRSLINRVQPGTWPGTFETARCGISPIEVKPQEIFEASVWKIEGEFGAISQLTTFLQTPWLFDSGAWPSQGHLVSVSRNAA